MSGSQQAGWLMNNFFTDHSFELGKLDFNASA